MIIRGRRLTSRKAIMQSLYFLFLCDNFCHAEHNNWRIYQNQTEPTSIATANTQTAGNYTVNLYSLVKWTGRHHRTREMSAPLSIYTGAVSSGDIQQQNLFWSTAWWLWLWDYSYWSRSSSDSWNATSLGQHVSWTRLLLTKWSSAETFPADFGLTCILYLRWQSRMNFLWT